MSVLGRLWVSFGLILGLDWAYRVALRAHSGAYVAPLFCHLVYIGFFLRVYEGIFGFDYVPDSVPVSASVDPVPLDPVPDPVPFPDSVLDPVYTVFNPIAAQLGCTSAQRITYNDTSLWVQYPSGAACITCCSGCVGFPHC